MGKTSPLNMDVKGKPKFLLHTINMNIIVQIRIMRPMIGILNIRRYFPLYRKRYFLPSVPMMILKLAI